MTLNREQIVKALECCGRIGEHPHNCGGCPLPNALDYRDRVYCRAFLARYALALYRELTESLDRVQKQCGEIIVECDERDAKRLKQVAELTIELDAMRCAANSYKMDNQRLAEENEMLKSLHKTACEAVKIDTARKMQEMLKAKAVEDESLDGRNTIQIINAIWVDKIAKELLEEEGNER